jgi:arsenical pump membrane protein
MFGLAVTLTAFAVVALSIIRPFTIRLSGRGLRIGYAEGAAIGALLVLLLGALTPGQAWSAILGRPGFSPYTLVILFMSMAYIAISLDSTGFFEYASLRAIRRSGGSRRRLFLYFFLLSSAITLFTSNDIVILTLTPIIFYFGKHAKLGTMPFLMAEFFAANIWSMALYVGNPTNIIVAMANGIGFAEYSYWMALPTLAAGLACLALLYLAYRKDVSGGFSQPRVRPSEFIKDRMAAAVTLAVFVATMAAMVLSPLIGLELWQIALISAAGLFAFDSASAFREFADKRLVFYHAFKRYAFRKESRVYQFRLHMIATGMPWRIIPFLLCVFVMVDGLVVNGFADMAAAALDWLSPNVLAAVLSMGFLSALASNVMNNQPMTVLFTKITESPAFGLQGPARPASIYSLIIGSNLGANLTIIGALAGIMWAGMLKGRGEEVSYRTFAKLGFLVTPVCLAAACIVLALEFMLAG